MDSNLGFPGGINSNESACEAEDTGDMGSIPGLGRSPGEGNGNPFQYSCLGNPMDRRAWRAIVHGAAKSRTQLDHVFYSFSCLLAFLFLILLSSCLLSLECEGF